LFFPVLTQAQTSVLSGRQVRQEEKDAILESKGVRITSKMLIDSISCDCDGFWIMRGGQVKKRVRAFWSEKVMETALGYELSPDTYYVYPNIREDSVQAEITVWLKRKKK